MLLTLCKLAQYGFNQRALTIDDFHAICEKEGIEVIYENVDTSFYMVFQGSRFIVISKKLNWLQQLYVAYHELSHALTNADAQVAASFFGLQDSPEEREANAFAAIALIPLANIEDTSIVDNCCCGLGKQIYEQRKLLYETYGV